MKMKPKEIMKNKADKMIDLISDEVEEGGVREISATFKKNGFRYRLTVKVAVEDGDDSNRPPSEFESYEPDF